MLNVRLEPVLPKLRNAANGSFAIIKLRTEGHHDGWCKQNTRLDVLVTAFLK